jgi:peptidoglycan/xylan/chitin deacetylase (PgdA/CDA1 family)
VLVEAQSQTGLTTTPRRNITADDLLEIRDSGLVSVGAHTQTHPILSLETDEGSRGQIMDSVRELSAFLGQQVSAFAYPNGIAGVDFGDRERRTLDECGLRLSFTTRTGFVGQSTDPLEIPRIGFAGSRHESKPWVSGKLRLTPVWDRSRGLLTRTGPAKRRRMINAVVSDTRASTVDTTRIVDADVGRML